MMQEHKIGALVVCGDQGDLIGMFTERDIIRGLAEKPGSLRDMRVGDLFTTNVVTCTSEDEVKDVITRMGVGGFRHMPVTDDSEIVGIVSVTDIFRHFATKSPDDHAAILEAYANASPPGS